MIKLKSLILENINLFKKTKEIYDGILITAKTHKQSNDPFGVNEKDLPYMENWPLRTKNNETYVVIVKAEKNNKLIGKSMLGYWGDYPTLQADSIYVNPNYKGRGLANKMYDVAETHIGGKIMKSIYQTPAGKNMWKKRMSLKEVL